MLKEPFWAAFLLAGDPESNHRASLRKKIPTRVGPTVSPFLTDSQFPLASPPYASGQGSGGSSFDKKSFYVFKLLLQGFN